MEVLDIHLERPTNFPPTIAMVMVFLMVKVLKYLRVMKDVDICLLRQEILLITFLEFIIVVMVVEVDIRLKRPANLPISIVEFIIVVIIPYAIVTHYPDTVQLPTLFSPDT